MEPDAVTIYYNGYELHSTSLFFFFPLQNLKPLVIQVQLMLEDGRANLAVRYTMHMSLNAYNVESFQMPACYQAQPNL